MDLFRNTAVPSSLRNVSVEAGPLLEDGTEKEVEKEMRTANGHTRQTSFSLDNLQVPRFRPIHLLKRILVALLPSFLHARLLGDTTEPERLFPTAHLDGLRGVAAFFVFIGHLSYGSFDVLSGYGSTPETWHFLQLPIIRLFYAGHAAVALFFVISGYSLSVKPIKQMRAGAYDGLLQTVSSTAFRRGFRLFLPTMVASFMIMLAVYFRFYDVTRQFANSKLFLRRFNEFHKPRKGSFALQFRDWYTGISRYFYVWDNYRIYAGSIDYDLHLWTIPVEFRASMVLLITQVGIARLQPRWRIVALLLLNWFAFQWQRWEMCLFWWGAILAEYDLIMNALKDTAAPDSPMRRAVASQIWFWFWIVVFIIGLFLCSYPEIGAERSPGYITLDRMIPREWDPKVIKTNQKFRLWLAVGAVTLLWSINNLKVLTNLFNGPVIRYLGKISYALYLTHGLVIHTYGYFMMMFSWYLTGIRDETHYVMGFLLSTIFIVPAVILVADWFWRAVDLPSVRFAKWLESTVIMH